MKQKHWILRPVVWLSLFVAIFAYCRYFLSFNYYFVEQFSFFRFSKEYAVSTLGQPGGLANYLSNFLIQFYLLPEIGPIITACLGVLLTIFLELSIRKVSPKFYLPLLTVLPAVACIWSELDFNYYLAGTVALILSAAAFFLYLKTLHRIPYILRLVILVALSFPLHFLIGPYSLLTVVLCVISEIHLHDKKSLLFVSAIPLALVAPILFYYMGLGGELSYQLLPKGYYLNRLPTPSSCYYPSLLVLIPVILAKLFSKKSSGTEPKKSLWERLSYSFGIVGLELVAVFALGHWGVKKLGSATNYEAKIFDYYTRTGDWSSLLQSEHLRASQNFMHTCYQNLALSSLGMMGDRFFSFPQLGPSGMVIHWNKTCNSSTLLSDVYWHVGDVALAQEMAFEGMISSRDGVNPRLLMRLVQTNLVAGNYPVAEKYIGLLEKTYLYAAKANHYRTFLYNDEAVMADAELGSRRRAMKGTTGLTVTTSFVQDLAQIIKNNPSHIPAYHYLGFMALLVKDIPTFKNLIETSHHLPALSKMPIHFQEAIILSNENESDKWEELGVGPQVIKRYEEYKNTFLANRGNPMLERKLAAKFGNTYWYYFMFKK